MQHSLSKLVWSIMRCKNLTDIMQQPGLRHQEIFLPICYSKSAAMWCVETMTQMHEKNRFRSPARQPGKKKYSIPFCWLFDRNSTYLESSSLGILWNSLWEKNGSFCVYIYIYCSQRLEQKSIYQPGFFFADLGDLGRSLESEFFR